jgi:hypothetical protein
VFHAIRSINERLVRLRPDIGRDLAERLDRVTRHLTSNRIADNREYFYALQPPHRLALLAERLVTAARLPN